MQHIVPTSTETSTRPDQRDGARLDLARVIEALPDAVATAMQAVLPDQYTPELAAQIAEDAAAQLAHKQPSPGHFPWCRPGACIAHTADDGDSWTEHIGAEHHVVFPSSAERPLHLVAQLGYDPNCDDAPTVHLSEDSGNVSFLDTASTALAADRAGQLAATLRELHGQMSRTSSVFRDDGPLTAQLRGAEWMARWSCPPWCISEHGDRFGMDWHSTAPVETTLRDIDASTPESENARIPFLAARIVLSNDKAQAYGRETRVWLDYGTTTGELTAAKAREVLTAMRGFVIELEAVVDQAEEIAMDDFDGDSEIARLDREAGDRDIARRTAELEAKADAILAVARA
ncbi:hypothetical protein ABS735_28485 [Streptomyces sp. MMCC 100]|uniref:DUF6907 domain-containing protein n=1 Tax=Streptomyces sp. MMCC 100 TaxID=3163555 RepID=UPI0035983EFC